MEAYIITLSTALVSLLIASFISNTIKYEGGSNPQDPKKRKTWFWIMAILNPVVAFLLGYFIFKPDANIMVVNKYMSALSIGTAAGFFVYIVIGFALSKMFKNGKIGNWF